MIVVLVRTLLMIYTTILNASLQSGSGKIEFLLIMSLNVIFHLSITPFIMGEPCIVDYDTILHSSRYLTNGTKRCFTVILTTTFRSDDFDSFVKLVLNFSFKILNTSNDCDFLKMRYMYLYLEKSSKNIIKYCWPFKKSQTIDRFF